MRRILCACFVMTAAAGVFGQAVMVEVEGVVDTLSFEGGFAMDGSVSTGVKMTGFCIFDPEVSVINGSYTDYSLTAMSLTVGNYTFAYDTSAGELPLLRKYPQDHVFAAFTDTPVFTGTIYEDGIAKTWSQVDWQYTYMELFNLYTSVYRESIIEHLSNIDHFDIRREFHISMTEVYPQVPWMHDGSLYIRGDITSINIVPEPGTMVLLAIGGILLKGRRRSSVKK